MFTYRFSRIERWWLLALRLAWHYRSHGAEAARLIDRLMSQAGLAPCARDVMGLLAALEERGADHLYIERFDQPGVTGDERDLIRALTCCYLDDPLGAELHLGALLPPGRTVEVIDLLQSVARPKPSMRAPVQPALQPRFLSPAACH